MLGYQGGIVHNIVINGGTFTASDPSGMWVNSATLTGGTINGGGHFDMQTFTGYTSTITVNASASPSVIGATNFLLNTSSTFSVASGGTAIVSSSIPSVANGLTQTGSGLLQFTGANAYTGATIISGGTLMIGNGSTTGALSASSSISNNGTLAFNRSNAIAQEPTSAAIPFPAPGA